MSKRTLALIILLVLVTGALLYIGSSSKQKTASIQPSITPTYVGHTILSLVPNAATPAVGLHRSVNIFINTMGDNTTAAQAEIAYDPKAVTNVQVAQGSFFDNPIVLFNTVDQKNGRLSFAVGIKPEGQPQKGTGTVATISYTVLPGATGSTTFTFLPKTKVTAEGVSQSVLKTANNVTLPL